MDRVAGLPVFHQVKDRMTSPCLQATFYPIEARRKGATATQFGAVFGIIHLSLFIFGNLTKLFFVWVT